MKAIYDALLTSLCQTDQACIWGAIQLVNDPARAMREVVTNTLAFGNELVRPLAEQLREYADEDRLSAKLRPLVATEGELEDVMHVTASCGTVGGRNGDWSVVVWDAGRGSRMGTLAELSRGKGNVEVIEGVNLYQFAAGSDQWLVARLRETKREYVAFVASDQIVCLDEPT